MDSTKCRDCNWEFPTKLSRCPVCASPNREYNKRYFAKRRSGADKDLKNWLEVLSQHPCDPLTEQEWLDICTHFGKCAFCEEEDISARVYFIPFELGGKYTKFNVLPACEMCSTEFKVQMNPFKRLCSKRNTHINSRWNKRGLGKLEEIKTYLMEEINAQSKQS